MSDKSITELLVEYMVRKDGGDADVLEEMCARQPEQADQLRARIELMDGLMHQLDSLARSRVPRYLGDYRIMRELGRGGMGRVFVAEDQRSGREVALKVLPYQYLASESARERFRREASAIGRLQHPGIVPFYGIGEADGIPFFAMELQRGTTLSRVLRRLQGRDANRLSGEDFCEVLLSAEDGTQGGEEAGSGGEHERDDSKDSYQQGSYIEVACRLVIQVGEALQHAHERGVIHRDVKPSNIWVDPTGRTKLFDFGLAQVSAASTLTVSGVFAGTLSYASPEQVRGKRSEIDHRTDIYSLGVTLYELLTLHLPFSCDSTEEVYRKILLDEPRATRRINPLVPRDLDTICRKAMGKEPAWRYQGAAAMVEDLRSFLDDRPIKARAPGMAIRTARWVRLNPLPAGIGAVAILALLATALLLVRAGGLGTARALQAPMGRPTGYWRVGGEPLAGQLLWRVPEMLAVPPSREPLLLELSLRIEDPSVVLDGDRTCLRIRDLGRGPRSSVGGSGGEERVVRPVRDPDDTSSYHFRIPLEKLGDEGSKEMRFSVFDADGRVVTPASGSGDLDPWKFYLDRDAPVLALGEPGVEDASGEPLPGICRTRTGGVELYRIAEKDYFVSLLLAEARPGVIVTRVDGKQADQVACDEILEETRGEQRHLKIRLPALPAGRRAEVAFVALNGSGYESQPVVLVFYEDGEKPRLAQVLIRPEYGDREASDIPLPRVAPGEDADLLIDGGDWLAGRDLVLALETTEPVECQVLSGRDTALPGLPGGFSTTFETRLAPGRAGSRLEIELRDRVGLESEYTLAIGSEGAGLGVDLAERHPPLARVAGGREKECFGVRADASHSEIVIGVVTGRPVVADRCKASLVLGDQSYEALEVRMAFAPPDSADVIIPAAILPEGLPGLLRVKVVDRYGESADGEFLLERDETPPRIDVTHLPGFPVKSGAARYWLVGGGEERFEIEVETRDPSGLDAARVARRLYAEGEDGGRDLLEGLALPRRDGRYRLEVEAYDVLGNPAVLERTFVVDVTPPTIESVVSKDLDQEGDFSEGTVAEFSVVAEDNRGVKSIDLDDSVDSKIVRQEHDAAGGTGALSLQIVVSASDRTLRFRAVDVAGNSSEPYLYRPRARIVGAPEIRSYVGTSGKALAVPMVLVEMPGREEGYYVDTTEVTVAQFARFLEEAGKDGGYDFEKAGYWSVAPRDPSWRAFRREGRTTPLDWRRQLQNLQYPVTGVSLWEARAFALWAGKGLLSADLWEFAACGGLQERVYPTGNEPPDRDLAWYDHRDEGPRAVGKGAANAMGFYDMGGNVAEWVEGAGSDGTTGRGSAVVCGGSFYDTSVRRVACAYRRDREAQEGAPFVGFRCACAASATPDNWSAADVESHASDQPDAEGRE